ncbi:hypothetical protein [Rhizobium leguminosarum]|uniref:Uncharacterized protein n=1 Tax=Rhizobium leguminosarum TaxID=384 RepID=A0A7M3DW71_RHILE|nr:hypothetical protein [Rhizobium leguminosarum]TAY52935.1 hypothetical protein ELH90_15520 [Rhizobium leguminosarum]
MIRRSDRRTLSISSAKPRLPNGVRACDYLVSRPFVPEALQKVEKKIETRHLKEVALAISGAERYVDLA